MSDRPSPSSSAPSSSAVPSPAPAPWGATASGTAAAAAPGPQGGKSAIELDIAQGQLRVEFQPIVDLESRAIFAHEAFGRSASGRLAGPLEMFAAAGAVGKVGELGQVLRQLAVQHAPPLPLFINVSPTELQSDFLSRPDEAVFAHGAAVYIELSESVPMRHRDLCQTVLRDLRSRGVFLAIDDLGADMSNLQAIADLAPDIIKLDRAMVAGLHTTSRKLRFVKHLVRLCTDMGSRVVAEGIESHDELRAIAEAGVQFAQGHFFARPSFPAVDTAGVHLP